MQSDDIARDVLKIIAPGITAIAHRLVSMGKTFAAEHDLAGATAQYLEQMGDDCGRMQILGMEQAVPLQSIYTEVRALKRVTSREFRTLEELERAARASVARRSLAQVHEVVNAKLFREIVALRVTAIERQYQIDVSQIESQRPPEGPHEDLKRQRRALNKKRDLAVTEANTAPPNEDEAATMQERFPAAVAAELQRQVQEALRHRMLELFEPPVADAAPALPAVAAIQGKNRVVMLGRPGAGKTTFFKHLVLRELAHPEAGLRFPLLVSLRDYVASSHGNVLEFMADGLAIAGFSQPDAFLQRLLAKKGSCFVLFDGLDEMSVEQQDAVAAQIRRMSKRYPHNQIIVSCRTATYHGQLEGFSELEIADFSPEQVKMFVWGWFRAEQELAASFLVDLRRHVGLQELAATPLLLAMLCIGYRRNQQFPDLLALIYLACLDALLVDWDSTRQVRRGKLVESFDAESKRQLIAKIACDYFCENELFFTEQSLLNALAARSEHLPVPKGSARPILRELAEHHGLLVERAVGIYSFSHLSIHEFLTALHISRSAADNVLQRVADEVWGDDRWREVAVFAAGLLPKADPLLVCLRNRAKQALIDEKAIGFLYGGPLPPAAAEAVRWPSPPHSPQVWEQWFRWRLFEYQLYKVSFGDQGMQALAGRVASASSAATLRLSRPADKRSDPTQISRPMNQAFKDAIADARPFPQAVLDPNCLVTLLRYAKISALILDLMSFGSRVSPEIRNRVAADLPLPNREMWEVKTPGPTNRLGI